MTPNKHPYATTSAILGIITQLRNSFPAVVNIDTLKKLGIGSQNETRIINILKFIGVIDENCKKTGVANQVFSLHNDTEFSNAFEQLIHSSYNELFNNYGDSAWTLDQSKLVSFFRANDGSTAIVGKLQANTFITLAAFSGHGEVRQAKRNEAPKSKERTSKKSAVVTNDQKKSIMTDTIIQQQSNQSNNLERDFGLTVRIEINLPTDASQETYDKIFRSIKENLIKVG